MQVKIEDNRGRVEAPNKGDLESKRMSMTCKRDVKENKEMLWVLILRKINFFFFLDKEKKTKKKTNQRNIIKHVCLGSLYIDPRN